MPHLRTYYLRNPISTQVQLTHSRKERTSLRSYGWIDATKAQYDAYVSALVESKVRKFITGLPSLH